MRYLWWQRSQRASNVVEQKVQVHLTRFNVNAHRVLWALGVGMAMRLYCGRISASSLVCSPEQDTASVSQGLGKD